MSTLKVIVVITAMSFISFPMAICLQSLIFSAHALEGNSSHFVCLSICLSVDDLEDGILLALQRDTNLKSATL